MQKRNNNKNQKKNHPLLPDFSAISAISAIFPPKHDPPCEGSYNSRRHWNETPSASQALTAAHHRNHGSDNPKTLVNSHKLSPNANMSRPAPNLNSVFPSDAKLILTSTLSSWSIGNAVQRVLDEDESRIRHGHTQHNLAVLRPMALYLLCTEKSA